MARLVYNLQDASGIIATPVAARGRFARLGQLLQDVYDAILYPGRGPYLQFNSKGYRTYGSFFKQVSTLMLVDIRADFQRRLHLLFTQCLFTQNIPGW